MKVEEMFTDFETWSGEWGHEVEAWECFQLLHQRNNMSMRDAVSERLLWDHRDWASWYIVLSCDDHVMPVFASFFAVKPKKDDEQHKHQNKIPPFRAKCLPSLRWRGQRKLPDRQDGRTQETKSFMRYINWVKRETWGQSSRGLHDSSKC